MQDDFVCGTDYESCLDPTGKYIVNGAVVVGSTPGKSGGEYDATKTNRFQEGLYSTWNYSGNTDSSAWAGGNVSGYITANLTSGTGAPSATAGDMVHYLQAKVGYVDNNGKSMGMCIAVLNKCQNYTYSTGSHNTYKGDNDVIKNYLERTLGQIKTMQDEVLAKYGESCINNVSSCLSMNNYSANQATAKNACDAQIRTCASVVSGKSDDDAKNQIIAAAVGGYQCPAGAVLDVATQSIPNPHGSATTKAVVKSIPEGWTCTCQNVGKLFNNACPSACPIDSDAIDTPAAVGASGADGGNVGYPGWTSGNTYCKCKTGKKVGPDQKSCVS
jgi:hypothetical protein